MTRIIWEAPKITEQANDFSIYHNTNCKDLLFNLGTRQEAYIKQVCSSDTNIYKIYEYCQS